MKMIWSGWQIKENNHLLVNHFHRNFHSKTPSCRKIESVFRDVKWCYNASWGLNGLKDEKTILVSTVVDISVLRVDELTSYIVPSKHKTFVLHVYYMCITCVLHLYYMCITCVLHVYCMCIACVLHVYYMCIAFVLHVYYMCITCVLHVYYMCITCILHVYYMCITCVLHVYYMCITCVLHVYYMCITCVIHVAHAQTGDKKLHNYYCE